MRETWNTNNGAGLGLAVPLPSSLLLVVAVFIFPYFPPLSPWIGPRFYHTAYHSTSSMLGPVGRDSLVLTYLLGGEGLREDAVTHVSYLTAGLAA